jgi:hypothetical protein
MQKNKTQRRARLPPAIPMTADVPMGSYMGDTVAKATEDGLDAFFAAESTATFHQPWQKLDRGSRLDRLRKFVQAYPDLTPAERASLLTAVLQAFELRQLNTKVAVEYDAAAAVITSIRGLRERLAPSGLKTFRIDTTSATAAGAGATRTTHKQRKTAATGAPAAAAAVASNPLLNAASTVESKGPTV